MAPAEADVGVMPFGLGEFAHLLNEAECFSKIAKSKCPLDSMGIIAQLPSGDFCLKPLRFVRGERRNPAAARRAGSFGQRVGHGVLLPESHLVGGMPKVRFHPPITPNTMSNDPMIAATSANIYPR